MATRPVFTAGDRDDYNQYDEHDSNNQEPITQRGLVGGLESR
jgi:hypothetical protein